MKILLVRLDHLGDLILTTPLVRALAKAGHQVEVLIPRWLLAVVEGNPHVKRAFAIENIVKKSPRWLRLGQWMKSQAYDAILLPNPKPRSLLLSSLISGAQVRVTMQAGPLGRLTAHRNIRVGAAFMKGRHFTDVQLDLARALSIPTDGLKPDYFFHEGEIDQARQKITSVFPDLRGEPIIGIHPGTQGNTCTLSSSVYGELASLILNRTNFRIIVTGSSKEKGLLDSWPAEVLKSPRVYLGMGELYLRMLAAVISQMNHYVIGSTGPLHLASAIGTQTISPFCAITPLAFSVWGNVTELGAYVTPNARSCRYWTAQAPPHHHCDFRGEVTAENLWACLSQKIPPV